MSYGKIMTGSIVGTVSSFPQMVYQVLENQWSVEKNIPI